MTHDDEQRSRGGEQLPDDWDTAYDTTPPWDIGHPQPAFATLARAGLLRGDVLDLGCGTGEHTLLAAEAGAQATGVDLSPKAIAKAQAKADERAVDARFVVRDVLTVDELGDTFDVLLDCGFFHVLHDDDRLRLARVLRTIMNPGALYHLLCFSDAVPGEAGPRRIRQDEIRASFIDGLAVEEIEASSIETTLTDEPIPAWLARIRRGRD